MITVFFSDIAWTNLHQRPQHLALRFARRAPVLWIEPATLGAERFFHPVTVGENLYRLTLPQFPHNARSFLVRMLTWPISIIPPLRWLIRLLQEKILADALRDLRFETKPLQYFVQNFQFIDLIETTNPKRVVFDYIDNAFGFVRFPRYVEKAWLRTLDRADVVTATSPTLQRLIDEYKPGTRLVTNGVEYEVFASSAHRERPPDVPNDGKPVIGYVGAVYAWFDFDLVKKLAGAMGGAHIVLVGHEHPDVVDDLDSLQALPNVRFLGVRPYSAIPAYLRSFDIGIIPFLRNPLTESVNPVKLYEYSAAGLPTVSTFFSDDLNDYRNVIFVAATAEEFVALCDTALKKSREENMSQGLRDFARGFDWDARAEMLWKFLSDDENQTA